MDGILGNTEKETGDADSIEGSVPDLRGKKSTKSEARYVPRGQAQWDKGVEKESLTDGNGRELPLSHSSQPKMKVGPEYEQLRTIFQRGLRILGNIGNIEYGGKRKNLSQALYQGVYVP